MIHVIAIVQARPGCRDEILARFSAVVPKVRFEAGCIEYRPVVDSHAGLDGIRQEAGPDSYLVIEKWASQQALDLHAQTAHMAAFGQWAEALIEKQSILVMRDLT